jgi:hypothetical protein
MAEDIAPACVPVKILDIDELAATIRREFDEVRRAGCNALHHAMKAGDALNDAQERVTGNWKRWLRENCFVGVRTAFLYQRLARHRDQIEAAMNGLTAELSLRGALRLISTPKSNDENDASDADQATEPEESLFDHWKRLDRDAREGFLDQLGVDGLIANMSPAFRRELHERVARVLTKARPGQKYKSITLLANPPPSAGEPSRH